MEIRAINEKNNVEYPTIEEINEKDLAYNIKQSTPVIAKNVAEIEYVGGLSNTMEVEIEEGHMYVWIKGASSITGLVSFILSIVLVVVIFIGKMRSNKTSKAEPYKLKKVLKIMLIISIVVFILSMVLLIFTI